MPRHFTFTYTVTGASGCPGTDSETVTIILTSTPNAGVAQSALSVCNNSTTLGLFSLFDECAIGRRLDGGEW
ncbi:MAG: hypothetical protein IPL33_16960 [Sphingobacteriales bacterium]|nr:hypothetical protein [Sphingobacteriales bacterium]